MTTPSVDKDDKKWVHFFPSDVTVSRCGHFAEQFGRVSKDEITCPVMHIPFLDGGNCPSLYLGYLRLFNLG